MWYIVEKLTRVAIFLRYWYAGVAALLLIVLFVSCEGEPVQPDALPDVIEKGDTARRTLLVYMMAENTLSQYAGLDVDEIAKAAVGVPSDCRLFVYVDDNKLPSLAQYFSMMGAVSTQTRDSAFQFVAMYWLRSIKR